MLKMGGMTPAPPGYAYAYATYIEPFRAATGKYFWRLK